MPPPRRRSSAERIAAAVALTSALFALVVLVLWGRSYRSTDDFTVHGPGGNSAQFLSQEGRLMFGVFSEDDSTRRRWGWGRRFRSRLGDLQLDGTFFTSDFFGWGVALPHLLVIGFAAVPVLWWFFAFRARTEEIERRERGLCWVCGYDIRATRDRCPECGQPVDSAFTDLIDDAPSSAATT